MGIKRPRVPLCLSLVKFSQEIHRITMRSRWLGVLERINWLKQTCCIWSSTRRPANTKRKRECHPSILGLRFPRLHPGLHPWSLRRFADQKSQNQKTVLKKKACANNILRLLMV